MISLFRIFARDFPVSGCICLKGQHFSTKHYHWWKNNHSYTNLFVTIFPNLSDNVKITPYNIFFFSLCISLTWSSVFLVLLYLWMTSDPKSLFFSNFVWSGFQFYYFCIINGGWRTRKYSCKLTRVKIHEVLSQINHTQYLHSKYWQTDNTDWVCHFWSQRQIETSGLWLQKISFTTKI